MIVKILKSTGGFSGVLYSELKINEGKGTFCGAFNFPFDDNDVSIDNYVNYFNKLIDTSKNNIKNKQFHAVISTKGKEHDINFLTEISKKWMQKMGYGAQPYLIYFHNDTENNHVHIVSCRIDKNGCRINPYMERRRAVIAINELMNENLGEKAKADIQDIMNNYNFSTTAQFRLALEKRGWKTTEKDGKVNVIKVVVQGNILIDDVLTKTQEYKPNEMRKKQLRAIFHKYKGLPTEQFQDFMRQNFGVDVVFHIARGHTKPYGYTVIDYNNKHIFKGSEIMPVQSLANPLSNDEHKELVNNILSNFVIGNNLSYSELKKILNRSGYNLVKDSIKIKGDNNELSKISNELYKKLRYNDRLRQANKFTVLNMNEAIALSKIFFVQAKDITLNTNIIRDDTDLRDTVNFLAQNEDALNEWLNAHNMALVSLNNNTYIIDARNSRIADVGGLGINSALNLDSYSENYGNSFDNFPDNAVFGLLFGLFAAIAGGLSGISGEEQDDTFLVRKKKKKRRMLL